MALLDVKNLSVSFKTHHGDVHAVKNVSFSINKGELLALVGESGSGKSTVAMSVLQLLPYPTAYHPEGSSVTFEGKELINANEQMLRNIRGNRISMIFQEPMSALNPLHNIFKQVSEVLFLHQSGLKRPDAVEQVRTLLDEVGLSHLKDRLNAMPHQLSGGERQRVMIAMAMANKPDLLIADEPTTALDVTVQSQVLTLLKDLQKKSKMAILLITHDLTIVRKVADRVAVMQQGQIVETNTTEPLFTQPQHAYTQKLLASEPSGEALAVEGTPPVLMRCENLVVKYPSNKPLFPWNQQYNEAVKGLSVAITEGTTVGVVGESGSGKSTLGFSLLRLIRSEGSIVFLGERIDDCNTKAMRPLRHKMQLVFQDPYSSLNPRMTVGQIIGEGLEVHNIGASKAERQQMIVDMLQEVDLPADSIDRYPHEFSGGQRQRISIARAMILKPQFIVLDEPTSALDLSVQAQIIDLLRDFQQRYGLSYMFISHDLRVVKALSHYVIVMKKGEIVEEGSAKNIFDAPQNAYTKKLIDAAFGKDL
ncbi:MAG: ABC transporter ATP-binding protein [Alphaproteobacteria bacterium]|nr:ABC transporter ATP-binding protein [Alphaproteobacteria bacterium]